MYTGKYGALREGWDGASAPGIYFGVGHPVQLTPRSPLISREFAMGIHNRPPYVTGLKEQRELLQIEARWMGGNRGEGCFRQRRKK